VTLAEVVVGGLVVVVGLLGWMSLLLAHLRHHSLPGVLTATVAALAVTGWLVARLAPMRVTVDRLGGVVTAVVGIVAGVFYFPGFHYAATDKDPGTYVAISMGIARYGSYSFPDVLAQHVPNLIPYTHSPESRFPAIWVADSVHHTIVPQFYHLWPALLATSYDAGGFGLVAATTPFIALLSTLVAVLLLRRVVPGRASLPTALMGGLLLSTNMLQVWQAKYSTSEALTQLFYLSALLGVVIALRTGWRPAAGFAGLCVGLAWLTRADAVLWWFVVVGTATVLLTLRRWDARCSWFAVGVGITLPHVLWQAYVGAATYTRINHVPSFGVLVAATLIPLLVEFVVRRQLPVLPRVALRLASDSGWQLRIGVAVCAAAGVLLFLGFELSHFVSPGTTVFAGRTIRTYDEVNLLRLSWFLTVPGFVVMGLGLMVVTLCKWSGPLWVVTLPFLLIFPVYGYHAEIAARLMWWGRRYVPVVLPGFVSLVAIALGFAMAWQYRRRAILRIPALATFGFLLVVYTSQSWPLHRHDEFGGSYRLSGEIAATATPGPGVFLWQPLPCCGDAGLNFGAAVWLERNQFSAFLPVEVSAVPGFVRRVANAMPGHPVFLVYRGTTLPAALSALALQRTRHITGELPMWTESNITRPDKPGSPVPVDITLWRYVRG
jgi:hypothetical protein